MALKKSQKSLKKWTKQKWRTASGKKSSETGEVYAPAKKIKKLKSTAAGRRKLAAANKKKRAATKKGKQHARHGLHKKSRRSKKKQFVGRNARTGRNNKTRGKYGDTRKRSGKSCY